MAILEVSNLKKIYTTRFGGNQVQALKNINFSVEEGEYVAIMGESGSGKTTLLNILAALDKPTAGEVLLNGKNLVSLKEKEISAFRRPALSCWTARTLPPSGKPTARPSAATIWASYFRILICLTIFH